MELPNYFTTKKFEITNNYDRKAIGLLKCFLARTYDSQLFECVSKKNTRLTTWETQMV